MRFRLELSIATQAAWREPDKRRFFVTGAPNGKTCGITSRLAGGRLTSRVFSSGTRNTETSPSHPTPAFLSISQSGVRFSQVVSSSIFRRRWVDTLLALLGSSWDRTRSLAYSVLARFPCPLAGYEGAEGGKRLAAEGLRLSGSGRQQESDRGALILRLVFVSHARGLGLDVPLFAAEIGDRGRAGDWSSEGKGGQGLGGVNMSDGDAGGQEEGSGDAAVRFLEGLRAVLSHRLGLCLIFVFVLFCF